MQKRDKVTYTTNITGKWRDFSIGTPQGKAIEETYQKVKILLKENKTLEVEKEADMLKELLSHMTSKQNVTSFVKVKDLFSSALAQQPQPVIEDRNYVVEMGKNKCERTLYLGWFEYGDPHHEFLQPSVVPTQSTKEKCEKMIDLHKARMASPATNQAQIRKLSEKYEYKIVKIKE